MNYWITAHWPQIKGEATSDPPGGVFVPEGRQEAGSSFSVGDVVFIYESQSGRTEIRKDVKGNDIRFRSGWGRKGIIAIVEATTPLLHYPELEATRYSNNAPITWSWQAVTKPLTTNGFVSLKQLNKVLRYKPNFNLRGFGDLHSGLKKISQEQFEQLLEIFKSNGLSKERGSDIPKPKRTGGNKYGGGGESEAHLKLKNYVADNPSVVLGEKGLTTVEVEYSYPTGDRADIILKDRWGNYIGVEIELEHNMKRFEGVLQAIKYRFMIAYMKKVAYANTRSMLIAHKISPDLKKECKKYEVECFEINY